MTAPDVTPDSLSAAAATGVRLNALRALRDSLAIDLDGCESLRDKSSLSQRFMDVLGQIEEAEQAKPEKAGTALDELANRRKAAGRPDSTGATRSTRTAKRV